MTDLHPILFALIGLIIFFLSIFTLTALSNLIVFPRLRQPTPNSPWKLQPVSILIPARNEAGVIGQTLAFLVNQSVPNLEILVLDDQSTDATAEIVRAYAELDPRVRLIQGKPLPEGWLGKNWACHQLSQAATGDLLLFTDADVEWRTDGVEALLTHQIRTGADLLTVWPTQITRSWSEFLVVPLMKFAIISYLPIIMTHFSRLAPFAAANGQCLLFTRAGYEAVGGHAAVRNSIVEDISLARATKLAHRPLRMADGGYLILCRMYGNWESVKAGFGKNLLAGHSDSLLLLGISTVWHWSAFVLPWLAVLFFPSPISWTWLGLALFLRWLADFYSDRRPIVALARAIVMPFSVALMTAIAWRSVRWHFGNGPVWKERVLNQNG